MGKKRTRPKKTSRGLRPSITASVMTAVRRDLTVADKLTSAVDAWRSGKNPWITIQNPNKLETNRLFYRIRANAYFGGTLKEIKSRVKRDRELVAD